MKSLQLAVSCMFVLVAASAHSQEQTLPPVDAPVAEAPPALVPFPEQPIPPAPEATPAATPDSASPTAPETAAPVPAQIQSPVQMIEGLLQEQSLTGNGFIPSYGRWQNSLFFKKSDAESIKRMLTLFESGALAKQAAEPTDPGISEIIRDLQIQTGMKEEKPPVYPRYKLRSIIYRSPAEWVILLNDIRISSYNNSADKELTVLDVGKNSASFKWKPTDDTLKTELTRDAAMRQNASGGSALTNRAAMGTSASFDKESRSVFFKLSVNQEFDSKTFDIQEGSLKQKAASAAAPTGEAEAETDAAPAAPSIPPSSAPFPSMQPVTNPMAPRTAPGSEEPAQGGATSPDAAPAAEEAPAASEPAAAPPIPTPANPLVPVPPPAATN